MNRVNQNLLDDLKINREIIERTRANVKKNMEVVQQEQAGITENQKDEFNKLLLSFSSTLDDYVSRLEAGDEPIRTVGLLIYRYNLLVSNLKKINYSFLNQKDKEELVNNLEDLEPKLEELYRYAKINNFSDLNSLGLMLKNFQNKLFQQIPVGEVRLKEIQMINPETETNIKFVVNYLSNLPSDKKNELSKTEIQNIEKGILKARQIEKELLKGKDVSKNTNDFNKIFQKILKTNDKIIGLAPPAPPRPARLQQAPQALRPEFIAEETPERFDPMGHLRQQPTRQQQQQTEEPEEEAPLLDLPTEEEEPTPPNVFDNPEYDNIKRYPKETIKRDIKAPKNGGLDGKSFHKKYKPLTKDMAKMFLDRFQK